MPEAVRGELSALIDRGILSWGAARVFYGKALTDALAAARQADPTTYLSDYASWIPGKGHASDMGRSRTVNVQKELTEIGLRSADDGDRASEIGTTSITWRVSLEMADAGLVKAAETIRGLRAENHPSGELKTVRMYDPTYEVSAPYRQALLVRRYRGSVLSMNPLDNMLFFLATPQDESMDMPFTAADQHIVPTRLLVWRNDDETFVDPMDGQVKPLHGTFFEYPEIESESESAA